MVESAPRTSPRFGNRIEDEVVADNHRRNIPSNTAKFDGSGKAKKWILTFELAAKCARCPTSEYVMEALAFLEGPAAEWGYAWKYEESTHSGIANSWMQFTTELRAYCSYTGDLSTYSALVAVKQTGSVAEYINRWKSQEGRVARVMSPMERVGLFEFRYPGEVAASSVQEAVAAAGYGYNVFLLNLRLDVMNLMTKTLGKVKMNLAKR